MSGASGRANGQASGPVLQSTFLVDLAHSGGEDNLENREYLQKLRGKIEEAEWELQVVGGGGGG